MHFEVDFSFYDTTPADDLRTRDKLLWNQPVRKRTRFKATYSLLILDSAFVFMWTVAWFHLLRRLVIFF